MCRKFKCKKSGWLASFSSVAVLAALIAMPSLQAAPIPAGCLNGGMASVITVSPTTAHVGDTINITQLGVSLGGSSCNVTNGQSFILYPNGVSNQQYQNEFALDQGQTITCLPPSGGVVNGCQAVTLTYVIQAADVGIPLTFTTPRGFASGSVPGTAKQVKFLAVSDALLVGALNLTAGGQGNAAVVILAPSLTITKQCVTNCAPYSSPFGSPISFNGTVCNNGDTDLNNVTVTDDPATTITFATTTSLGNPFPAGGGGSLAPTECVTYSGSYTPAGSGVALCGPFTDTVIASGTDTADVPLTVFATNSATCLVCTTPCIEVTKNCPTTPLPFGTLSFEVGGTVTNCGNVPLTGVKVVDNNGTPNDPADDTTINIGDLAVGGSAPWTATNSVPAGFCGNITNTATATGTNICTGLLVGPAQATCTVTISCQPCIDVLKGVVCAPATGIVGCTETNTYGEVAIGVAGTNSSAFCYQVIVTNCGNIALTNLTVNDDLLGNNLAGFTSPLAPFTSQTNYYGQSYTLDNGNPSTNLNTVIAQGQADSAGAEILRATNTATAIVLPISLVCDITLTGGEDNPVGCDVTLAANGPVTFTLCITNTGQADLLVEVSHLPALVDCADSTIPVTVPSPLIIAVGGTFCLTGCTDVSCPGTNFEVCVQGTAVATESTGVVCIYDANGNAVKTAASCCRACVNCVQPVTCRTTGGGQLIPGFTNQSCILVETTIFPATAGDATNIVFKVTHGGQLGAPYSHKDCGEILGNPCIRGQWEHNRHYVGKGNPKDTFTALHTVTPKGQFDSLTCACLPCCDPETGALIPATIGPGKKFQLCNPDDHKICGPMPRPAPANALIWSGIGVLKRSDDNGNSNKGAEWVILRVYIEDRSEPGGGHPGGSVDPADIYCFQAWKTGLTVSKKPDYNAIATEFRTLLAQDSCAFLEGQAAGLQPIGSLPSRTVNGVSADIVDCGPLESGNRQIHPSTSATCTP